MATREPAEGSTLGSIRLTQFVGEGSVGSVWKGRHEGLGIDVAVKVLKPASHASFHGFRERFRREAQLAARIDHRSVVRVLDCGEQHGHAYLVMEYVDGHTLEAYLRRHPGPLEENIGLRILTVIASGLSAAHAANVVHRDLKPGNVLIDRKGRLKIADFGLARDIDGSELTQQRVYVGSPGYMAPEALQATQDIDFRVDIYALGVIAYQFAFGRLPYLGSISQVIHGHIAGRADFDLPTRWSTESVALIRKLMATDRDDRPASASSVVRALRARSGASAAPLAAADPRRVPGDADAAARTADGRAAGAGDSAPMALDGAAASNHVGAADAVEAAGRTAAATASASGSAVVSSAELSGIARFFEAGLAEHVTVVDGRRIVHTSARERRVVWGGLLALFALALFGYLAFGRH